MDLLLLFKEIYSMFIQIAPFMLLGLFFVGLLHIFFSKEFIIKHIGKDNIASVIKSSILGVPLPLCSCGVIPTAVYMAKNGASKGAVVSFLISTPQTGIDSIIATYGMLGPLFAIYRPIVSFLSGIIGGIIVNLFTKEKLNINIEKSDNYNEVIIPTCTSSSCNSDSCSTDTNHTHAHTAPTNKSFMGKIKSIYNYAFVEFLDDIAGHFIIGVIISGLIAYFIPTEFFVKYSLNSGILAMLIMVIVGIPMYICATASIPIAITLMMKGVSPGVAFVFLAVGPLTNAASLTILAKIFKKKILAIYILTTTAIAMISGSILDLIFTKFDISIPAMMQEHAHSTPFMTYLYKVTSILFLFFLMGSIYRKYFKKYFKKEIQMSKKLDTLHLKIDGMSCNHCVNNVKNSLEKIDNIENVKVDLSTNSAVIEGNNLSKEDISKFIENIGYKVL